MSEIILTCKLIIDSFDGEHETTSDLDRVGSVSDAIKTGFGDGSGKNGGSGGAVTGLLIGRTGNILYKKALYFKKPFDFWVHSNTRH